MNKTELIEAMTKENELSKKENEEVLKSFISVTEKVLKKGDNNQMIGFGAFDIVKKTARKGKNPQTGVEINIPAAKFRSSRWARAWRIS